MRRVGNKGQTLVEYVLIIAVISVVVISAVALLGGVIKDKITEASCELLGEKYISPKEQNLTKKEGEKKAKSGDGYCEGLE